MIKRSVTVGINAYPNAPLSGCVNDALDWSDLLAERGYRTQTVLDEKATKTTILNLLRWTVEESRWGDRIVFTYSGHGSWVPDRDGDEADGRDEVLCAVDYEDGGYITDDELAEVFAARRRGVRVIVISDSCHSGTVTRFVDADGFNGFRSTSGGKVLDARRPRFVDPSTFLTRPSQVTAIAKVRRTATTLAPRASTGTVLLSGCTDEEYSYDATINGRPNGAFTEAAIRTYRQIWDPRIGAWHKATRGLLPSTDYPQTPQLYASLWQRTWTL